MIELVRDLEVIERRRMRVVTQRRGRIPVTEARLGSQELSFRDEERGHSVTQPMQCRLLDPGAPTQRPELVR